MPIGRHTKSPAVASICAMTTGCSRPSVQTRRRKSCSRRSGPQRATSRGSSFASMTTRCAKRSSQPASASALSYAWPYIRTTLASSSKPVSRLRRDQSWPSPCPVLARAQPRSFSSSSRGAPWPTRSWMNRVGLGPTPAAGLGQLSKSGRDPVAHLRGIARAEPNVAAVLTRRLHFASNPRSGAGSCQGRYARILGPLGIPG